jgi:hypothetical protein
MIKNLKKQNKKNSLREKFSEVENQIEKNVDFQVDASLKRDLENYPKKDFVFEEEIPWWEDPNSENEINGDNWLLSDCKKILEYFKKSELFMLVGKVDTLKIETIDNEEQAYILVTWDCDYMDLTNRRKNLNGIKQFKNEIKQLGSEVHLVHDHRRLGISRNIGIKVSVDKNKAGERSLNYDLVGETQI